MGNPWENLLNFLHDQWDLAVLAAKRVWRRLLLLVAAIFMLFAFMAIVLGGVFLSLVFLLAFLVTGSDWLKERITRFGQAVDSAANVVLLDGHPKETISSHVGRMYTAKYGNEYKTLPITDPDLVLPWPAPMVRFITDLGQKDHVFRSVEMWAYNSNVEI